jgi:predicted CXXCH cytochrome family protein
MSAGIESCRLCHSTHEGAPGSAGLVTGEDRGQERWLQMYAPGAGAVTLSCLRCHLTEAERVRQPEFSYMAPLTDQSTFIGTDLGNDHPLGSLDRLSLVPRVDLSDPRQMRPTDLSLAARHTVIECTTCHDPHDRVSGKPDALKQREVCGACHDPATYQYESHSDQACSECHSMHGAARQTLLADQDASRLCGRCHLAGSSMRASEDAGSGSVRPAPIPTSGEGHELGGDCLACHGGHQR